MLGQCCRSSSVGAYKAMACRGSGGEGSGSVHWVKLRRALGDRYLSFPLWVIPTTHKTSDHPNPWWEKPLHLHSFASGGYFMTRMESAGVAMWGHEDRKVLRLLQEFICVPSVYHQHRIEASFLIPQLFAGQLWRQGACVIYCFSELRSISWVEKITDINSVGKPQKNPWDLRIRKLLSTNIQS